MNATLRDRLLGELIDAIQHLHNLDHQYVHFFAEDGDLVTDDLSVTRALDCLYNDVYYFGEYDLRDARRLEVHVH
jgi:hypothetical protein